MIRSKRVYFGAFVLVASLAVPALVSASGPAPRASLKANMTGAHVVNGGAPGARGKVTMKVSPAAGKVCFKVTFSGIGDKATGAFIHKGKPGDTGPPKFTLFGHPKKSGFSKCVDGIQQPYLNRLVRKPSSHYADVTSAQYPNGAVRGQLKPTGT